MPLIENGTDALETIRKHSVNKALEECTLDIIISTGLPVCFDDVEITEDEFDSMADKAETTTEWSFLPKGVTQLNIEETNA